MRRETLKRCKFRDRAILIFYIYMNSMVYIRMYHLMVFDRWFLERYSRP